MSTTSNVTNATRDTQSAVGKNIVDTAAANGSFKIFGDALNRSGVAESLKGEGPFTMFAPTDAAFEQLPQGQLDTWLKPENKDELAAVMRYHVVQGRSSSTDIGKLKQAKTLQGQSVPIMIEKGKINVGDAELTAPDLSSGNGVVHGIDKVNIPTRPTKQ